MRTLTLFFEAVADLIDAMNRNQVNTIDNLGAEIDVSGPTEGIADFVDELLWDENNPEQSRDDAHIVALAAQIIAMCVREEMVSA